MTEGTKYHPLFEYLLYSGQGRLEMNFGEIESLLGAALPPSARKREEWWSNSLHGHSQARAWRRANYRMAGVDLASEKVVFELEGWPDKYTTSGLDDLGFGSLAGMGEGEQKRYDDRGGKPATTSGNREHPLFGIWLGKATLLTGFDYTKPAFEPEAKS